MCHFFERSKIKSFYSESYESQDEFLNFLFNANLKRIGLGPFEIIFLFANVQRVFQKNYSGWTAGGLDLFLKKKAATKLDWDYYCF